MASAPTQIQPPDLPEPTSSSYDRVLYPGVSYRQTHPDRLATQATLFGLTPAPVEDCRILEVGCGDGGNLVPMAFGLPRSQCTGIDSAASPLAQARSKARELGLTNLKLVQMDLRDAGPELGEFDYIIAHGVYSWVPSDVQDKLLSICSRNLAPQGVAYVSYNAYPGGHIREMMRRMMLYGARGVEDPRERVGRGLDLIQNVIKSLERSDPFRAMLEPEHERMREIKPESLYHDDFNEFYAPAYFYELIERAEHHGLQYLAEAALSAMWIGQVSLFGQRDLAGLDALTGEQMLDFKTFRRFRATLLCHAGLAVERALSADRVRTLWASSAVRCESPVPDVTSEAEETFRADDRSVGIKITTNHPMTKAALWLLGSRYPGRVRFDELEAGALKLVPCSGEGNADPSLAQLLLNMYGGKVVELHAHAPSLCESAGERPVASPLARLMLRHGNYVTNLRHEGIDLDDTLRRLVALLDGEHDRAALLDAMNGAGAAPAGEPEREPDHKADAERLEENLRKIARMALLIA